MATTSAAARLTALPDEETLAATTVALEEHRLATPSSRASRTAPPL